MKKFLDALLRLQQRQRLLFIALILAMFGLGAYIAYHSEIKAFPDLTNVQVQVITQFPGKAPEEIERQITMPMEVAMNGLPGLINQRSISIFGLSVVTLTFDDNVKARQARMDVAQRFSAVDLPEGVSPQLSPDSTPIGEIYRYTLKGNMPLNEQRLIQDWKLEREFKSIPGVADVVTFGGPSQTIEIQLNIPRMKAMGLTVKAVAEAISQNHANAGGSLITHGSETYIVRSIGRYEKPEQLETAVIQTVGNTPVRIRDIGKVQISHRPLLGQVARNQNDEVVEGIVLLRQGSDTLDTCQKIRDKVAQLNGGGLPPGVQIEMFYDRTRLIANSSHTVFHNIILGIVLVCVIMFLGVGLHYWQLVLAVVLIIPFALLTSFIGIKLAGLSPNLISLGAVDFGIIVETAIFSVEAVIATLVRKKKNDPETIITALEDVFGPALICALLLLIAFIPILSMQRVEGRIFKPLGITLVSALIGGQLGALIFVPAFSIFAPHTHEKDSLMDPGFEFITHQCEKIARRFARIKAPFFVFGVVFALVLAGLLSVSKGEFLPQLNEGSLYIRATAPATISREASVILGSKIRNRLLQIPEALDVISQTGRPDDGTDVNGFDNTEILVQLKPFDEWTSAKNMEDMIQFAQTKVKDIPGVDFNFSQPIKDNVDEAISGVKGELVIKITGPKLEVLQKIANQMAAQLKTIKGARDVAPEQLLGQPELRFKMDRDVLDRYGIRVADAEDVLESAMLGHFATRLTDTQGRAIPVIVKPDLRGQMNVESLSDLPVLSSYGANIPIRVLAKPKLVEGVTRIYREQGERRIAVKCSVRGRAVVDFVNEASKVIGKKIQLPQGYHSQWSGSFENAKRAAQTLKIVVPICVLMMVIVLQAWFGNWTDVGLIFWQVPFSLTGGLFLLKLFHLNLSISAAAGGIVLIGVSFLTGIMLISEWRHLGSAWDALHEASKSIFISSWVAIVGLVPAAFAHGIGSETAKPFAVMILGGLCTSLIFTLTLYPALLSRCEKPRNA